MNNQRRLAPKRSITQSTRKQLRDRFGRGRQPVWMVVTDLFLLEGHPRQPHNPGSRGVSAQARPELC